MSAAVQSASSSVMDVLSTYASTIEIQNQSARRADHMISWRDIQGSLNDSSLPAGARAVLASLSRQDFDALKGGNAYLSYTEFKNPAQSRSEIDQLVAQGGHEVQASNGSVYVYFIHDLSWSDNAGSPDGLPPLNTLQSAATGVDTPAQGVGAATGSNASLLARIRSAANNGQVDIDAINGLTDPATGRRFIDEFPTLRGNDLRQAVLREARLLGDAMGVPASVIAGQIEVESGWNLTPGLRSYQSDVGSSTHSYGIMQVTEGKVSVNGRTPVYAGDALHKVGGGVISMAELTSSLGMNLACGIMELKTIAGRHGGNMAAALSEYNQGSVNDAGRRYAQSVLDIGNRLVV